MRNALLAALLLLASCASIMTPKNAESEVVAATPVTFTTSNGITATTPAAVNLATGQVITFTWKNPDGSDGTYVSDPTRLHGWVWGNILIGGIVGIVIDAVNDSNRLHPEVITLPLAYKPGEEPPAAEPVEEPEEEEGSGNPYDRWD